MLMLLLLAFLYPSGLTDIKATMQTFILQILALFEVSLHLSCLLHGAKRSVWCKWLIITITVRKSITVFHIVSLLMVGKEVKKSFRSIKPSFDI